MRVQCEIMTGEYGLPYRKQWAGLDYVDDDIRYEWLIKAVPFSTEMFKKCIFTLFLMCQAIFASNLNLQPLKPTTNI